MTSTSVTTKSDDCESCTLCSSKYNRTRPSFCQCKHCSIPLCLDCTKEHHDELLQDITSLSHHYNQLQELIQAKQTMVGVQTTKTLDDVNNFFDTYITELRETQHKIIQDVQSTEQNAQNYLDRFKSDLHALESDIQTLTKEGVVQTAKMNNLSTEMKKMEEQIKTYRAIKTEKLIKSQPELTMKFECSIDEGGTPQSPDANTNTICEKDTEKSADLVSALDLPPYAVAAEKCSSISPLHCNQVSYEEESSCISDDNDDNNITLCRSLPTTYYVDRMASDGENILYTSYRDEDPDLIAYFLVEDGCENPDACREWKQSRIEDMVWWNSIDKFVCATNNGIYTVDYINGRFRILCVVRGNYSYIRIAVNTNNCFLHYNSDDKETNNIEVFTLDFKITRVFDIRNKEYFSSSSSFCVTNHVLASICTRRQNGRQVFQVNFLDLTLNVLDRVCLGWCNRSIEIRSDGNNLFFISTGRRNLHIVSPDKRKQTIVLNKSDCIAVLDNRRIAISHARNDIEVVTY